MPETSIPSNPVVDAVIDAAAIHGEESVVDLACGGGRLSLVLAGRYPRTSVLGTDVDSSAVEQARAAARSINQANAGFSVGDIENLDLADDFADAVVSSFGLLQVGDPKASVLEAARILRIDGVLALAAYSDMRTNGLWAAAANVLERHDGVGADTQPLVQPLLPDAAARRALMRAAGFGDVEESVLEFTIPLPDFNAVWTMVSHPGMLGAQISTLDDATARSVQDDLRGAVSKYSETAGNGYVFPASCFILKAAKYHSVTALEV